jgi:ornithine carbamoyltransferase
MDSKTIMMNPPKGTRPLVTLGIQSDTAFNETAKSLAGRDLCSIADLSVAEMAAIMELSHAVKAQPEDFRNSMRSRWF